MLDENRVQTVDGEPPGATDLHGSAELIIALGKGQRGAGPKPAPRAPVRQRRGRLR